LKRRWQRALFAALLLPCGLFCGAAQAGSLRFCDRAAALTAREQDRMLRLASTVRAALEESGEAVVLISRSGLDLDRFGQRYSHAGLALRASTNAPWSVRQLYYACDEGRPRVFDQGLAGFVIGMDKPVIGWVSLVLLPADAARALERAALDDRLAVQLLSGRYSANAFAFGTLYQNCNQWVAELMATAWGDGDADRSRAQAWLRAHAYRPTVFALNRPLLFVAGFVPWLHRDDHPADDLAMLQFRVSMPASIEDFVRTTQPGARRIEFCQAGGRIVVHRGWEPVAEGCLPGEGDEVITLD